MMGRACHYLYASLFFSPDEIRGAYLLAKSKVPTDHPPQLYEVLRLVARLDGFIGQKNDGEPGIKTIWLGRQEVRVAAEGGERTGGGRGRGSSNKVAFVAAVEMCDGRPQRVRFDQSPAFRLRL